MSNLLRIYREHALELLYNLSPTQNSKDYPATSVSYIDVRVLCQHHPAFPLYLLMSGPHVRTGIDADFK